MPPDRRGARARQHAAVPVWARLRSLDQGAGAWPEDFRGAARTPPLARALLFAV